MTLCKLHKMRKSLLKFLKASLGQLEGIISQTGQFTEKICIYSPSNLGSKYTRQILIEIHQEINISTIKVGDFYIPLPILIDKISNKEQQKHKKLQKHN